uniref:Uncharacterized protein n=1 Tax=Hyaloperonospora arabidopsidis (strain Emoy2) TaxID=559515 RepID=M4BLZ9_HYAAE
MTREVYVCMLKEKCSQKPEAFARFKKCLGGQSSTIKVQNDNAGPHVLENNDDILDAGRE